MAGRKASQDEAVDIVTGAPVKKSESTASITGKTKSIMVELRQSNEVDPNIDMITGKPKKKVEAPPKKLVDEEPPAPAPKAKRASLKQEVDESKFDPITGNPKDATHAEPERKTAGRKHTANFVDERADGWDLLSGKPKDAPPEPAEAEPAPAKGNAPFYTEAPASGNQQRHVRPNQRKLEAEEHANVDPVTGQKKANTGGNRSSAGAMRAEVDANGKNVDPITGQLKNQGPQPTRVASIVKTQSQEHVNVNPVTGEKIENAPRSSASAGATKEFFTKSGVF